ncbi:MAG: hypothetical protein DRG78_23715, partial [Epsilonproteobacteria bacterium]
MFKKILLSLFLLYTIVGFFVLPLVLKPQIVEIANKQINAKLSVEDISINPFIFKVGLSGVKLNSLDGKHLVSFKSLEVDVELYSLFYSALHVKSIKLKKPQISLIYNQDKSFNLTSILKPTEQEEEQKKEESSDGPRIIIDLISLEKGGIDYEDYTTGNKFIFSLNNIGFKLRDIDTNDFETSGGSFRFHTALGESGLIDIRTKITGLKPLKLEGSLDIQERKLYEELEYIKDELGIEVAKGSVVLHAEYDVNADDLNATTIDNVTLSLENLRVKPKDENQDVLNLKSFDVSGVTIKPFLQDVHVDNIALNSLHVKARRDENGNIDWARWFKQKDKVSSNIDSKKDINITEEKAPAWNVVLDNISLDKIALDLDDSSVSPMVTTKLNELNINLKDVTLAGEKPFLYNVDLLLNDKFTCRANGDVKHSILEVNSYLTCKDFDVIHYKPYIDQIAQKELKTYNISLTSANVSFDVNASAKAEDEQIITTVNNANFSLDKLAIDKKSTGEKLVGFKSFEIKGVKLNTKTKNVEVKKIALNHFKLNAKKDKDGAINLDGLIEPKDSKKGTVEKVKTKDEKPYLVELKHLNLNSAEVNFSDASIEKKTDSKIDKITLNAYDINSQRKTWLKYDMSLRINNGGTISSKGKVRHTPLKQKGSVKLDKISLKEITPYLQESMYVNLKDGFLSLDSKLSYEKSDKKPDLHVEGGVKIEAIELVDSRDDKTLLTFAKTELKSFNLDLFPSSLYIDEVDLDSFYVDAQIDKNKQMNLSKLSKIKTDENTTVAKD